ncbi:MAG: hypothetical protein WA814_13590 [Candidatus Baltobacteraceae bacterium]
MYDTRLLGPLFLLGCYHGANPGMGWLFAVALGFQERSTLAVLRAIVPLTLGHLVSVALVILLAVFAAVEFPHAIVHGVAAGVLLSFGIYRLVRARHPRWVGMRVGFWGLALWSFVMSTAHGAGLMLVPFVTASHVLAPGAMHMPMPAAAPAAAGYGFGWLIISVHTLGYLIAMTAIALVVYTKLGVGFLRTAWFNVDLVWALALLVAGVVALLT